MTTGLLCGNCQRLRAECGRYCTALDVPLRTTPEGAIRFHDCVAKALREPTTPPCELSQQRGSGNLMTAGKTAAQGGVPPALTLEGNDDGLQTRLGSKQR